MVDVRRSVDLPLLNNDGSTTPPPPVSPRRAGFPRHKGYGRSRLRRLIKPLMILAVPPLLVLLYAFVHPLLDLPPLPKVSIEAGGKSWSSSSGSSDSHIAVPQEEDQAIADEMPDALQASSSCICGATERGKELCDVYQKTGLRSSALHRGSGARIRHLLARARDGEDIKIGILGGSVSACRGVHPSPEFPEGDPTGPGCYTTLLRKWFEDTFPDTKVNYTNGAIGGMDSSYYAFCGAHHIPTDVDLIILEFDVNDQPDKIYQTFFDQLLRVLLEFKTQPAVLILGSWAPKIAQDRGYADAQLTHLPVAIYYDIPYISLKRLMFNHYTRFPHSTATTFFLPDFLHPNARGHRVLTDITVSYLESELCLLNTFGLPVVPPVEHTIGTSASADTLIEDNFPMMAISVDGKVDWSNPPEGWESTFDQDKIDAIGKEQRYFALPQSPYSIPFVSAFKPLEEVLDPEDADPSTANHIHSIPQPALFCADANDPDHPMQPSIHDGWEPYDWKGEKHYWVSSTVGARLRVPIKVSAGRVAIYYFRSMNYDLGDADCWVDDNEDGAIRLKGYWEKAYNTAYVSYIDRNVTMGDHYVTCEVSEHTSHRHNPDAHHFRIVAVMAT